MIDIALMQQCNRAASKHRHLMIGLYSDGPFTAIDFYIVRGQLRLARYREDTSGVRVAFLTSTF